NIGQPGGPRKRCAGCQSRVSKRADVRRRARGPRPRGQSARLVAGQHAHTRVSTTIGAVYAGIGARATPGPLLAQIEELGARLARLGWTLRTGMSPGADQAFYRGALGAGGDVELYLPCPDFQAQARLADERGRVRVSERPTRAAVALAARFYLAAA